VKNVRAMAWRNEVATRCTGARAALARMMNFAEAFHLRQRRGAELHDPQHSWMVDRATLSS